MLPAAPVPLTASPDLSRRVVLTGMLGLAGAAALPQSRASAYTYAVIDPILAVFRAAGGAHVLGKPTGNAAELLIGEATTYAQHFARGTVWWGSGTGKVDLPARQRVRLDTAPNFRPVTGVRSIWRSDDLDDSTALEQRIVHDLGVARMIAMNSGADPAIPGVATYKFHITNTSDPLTCYRRYVTRHSNRKAVGKVLQTVTRTSRPVLIHCSAGKDRTGWLSDLMQSVAGVPQAVRDADYLATRDYSGADVELDWLQAARDQLATSYGTVQRYLTKGCGLSSHRYHVLKARLEV